MSNELPIGFKMAGVKCGLKKDGYDIAIIESDVLANVAAVYTTNKAKAAPLSVCKKHDKNKIKAVVINSKNANALTGKLGEKNAYAMAELTANALNTKAKHVLVSSTGVIGVPLPMEKIEQGIFSAAHTLAPSLNNAEKAIMTSDKYSKLASKNIKISGKDVKVFGMAKGAGMIHPNMATMLAYVLTDASVEKRALKSIIRSVSAKTFNRISVDGDTSTNDTAMILANGESGAKEIKIDTKAYKTLYNAVYEVCLTLAKLMVKDGEGATKVVALNVKNAASERDAYEIAKTVATSPLVKTAYFGEDANWGRIIAAAGRAKAKFNPETSSLIVNGVKTFFKGMGTEYSEDEISKTLKLEEQEIILDCGFKKGFSDVYYFSDLTTAYVEFNSGYRS